jgi:hypothetical protein
MFLKIDREEEKLNIKSKGDAAENDERYFQNLSD